MTKKIFRLIALTAVTVLTLLCLSGCILDLFPHGRSEDSVLPSVEPSEPETETAPPPTDRPSSSPSGSKGDQNALLDRIFYDEFLFDASKSYFNINNLISDPEAYGIKRTPATFGRFYMADEYPEMISENEDFINRIRTVDREALDISHRTNYDLVVKVMELTNEEFRHPEFSTGFDYAYGVQESIPSVFSNYYFFTAQDVEDYLDLMAEVPELFENTVAFEKAKPDSLKSADFTIDDAIESVDNFLKSGKEDTLSAFRYSLRDLDLTEKEADAYEKRCVEAIDKYLMPAFGYLKEELPGLRTGGGRTLGLSNYPGGKDYYTALLQIMTYSDKTPGEMYSLIKERYSRLISRYRTLYSGYSDILDEAYGDREYTGMSASEMIAYAIEKSSSEFPETQIMDYELQPIPESQRNGSTLAYYVMSPIDREKLNNIYYDPSNMNSGVDFFSTLCHEGWPGHMYQWNYFVRSGAPELVLNFGNVGYMEGWAQYVNVVCAKMYDYGEFSRYSEVLGEYFGLDTEYGYLLSAMADILVNYYSFDRDKLYDTLSELGFTKDDSDSVFESVVSSPGLYPRYYIGMAELLELREEAENSLGDAFDPVEFHRAILDTGFCFSGRVEEAVDMYIQKAASLKNAA